MKRREFFTLGAKRAAGAAYQAVEGLGGGRPKRWLRPPYALTELDFLQNCTRCDKCVEACPHDVLFLLPANCGADVVGTPALDLVAKGCHLCADWPCVTVCEPQALRLPDGDEAGGKPLPKLATARILEDTCLPYSGPECGACSGSCPVPGALTWAGSVKPVIDPDLCTGCALCREVCITEPKSIEISAYIPPRAEGDELT